jgi:hypothetical protein
LEYRQPYFIWRVTMFRKAHFLNFLIVPALLALAACAQQQPAANVGSAPTATQTQEAKPVSTQEPIKPTPTATAAAKTQKTAIPTQEPAIPTPSVKIAACSEPVQLTPDGETFTYKHVQFYSVPEPGVQFHRPRSAKKDLWGMRGDHITPPTSSSGPNLQ